MIQGIGDDGAFPCLEGNVGVLEPGVLESEGGIQGDSLAAIPELVPVVQKLPLLDVAGLGVGESAGASMAGRRRRDLLFTGASECQ